MSLIFFEEQVVFIWINAEFFILLSAFYGVKIKRFVRKLYHKR